LGADLIYVSIVVAFFVVIDFIVGRIDERDADAGR
jgi:hypothetical protein